MLCKVSVKPQNIMYIMNIMSLLLYIERLWKSTNTKRNYNYIQIYIQELMAAHHIIVDNEYLKTECTKDT